MPDDRATLLWGVMLALGAHFAGTAILISLASASELVEGELGYSLGLLLVLGTLEGFGLVQALWIVPLYFVYRRRGPEVAKGIAITGGITFLLWSVCASVLFSL
jgi:hypothetical protein